MVLEKTAFKAFEIVSFKNKHIIVKSEKFNKVFTYGGK
jgi:hypothetical protein